MQTMVTIKAAEIAMLDIAILERASSIKSTMLQGVGDQYNSISDTITLNSQHFIYCITFISQIKLVQKCMSIK